MRAVYGIIGYPLSHSFSPAFFNERFVEHGIDAIYHPFPLERIEDFRELLLSQPGLRGLNVTIPYKQSIIQYLDDIDDTAKAIGAVNCILFIDSKLKGYNTDVIGFSDSLKPLLKAHHTSALVLGTGGSSLAVAYGLKQLGIPFERVSRHKTDNTIVYSELNDEMIKEHKLIINTTPLGMYPKTDEAPQLQYESLTPDHLLYDLVYNPEETKFMKLGKQQGAASKNGWEMLVLQAEASWKIWTSS